MSSTSNYPLDKVQRGVPKWRARPFQLVSLLDMIKFRARDFLRLAQYLKWIQTLIETDKEKTPGVDSRLEEDIKQILVGRLDSMTELCKDIGLELSVMLLEEIKHDVAVASDSRPSYGFLKFGADIQELARRIDHEMSMPLFLCIPRSKAEYFDQPALFGADVSNKFPDDSYDVQEAGNSLATGRNTACVMHLMRALEVALDATGLGVGVPQAVIEAKNSWETLLKKIDSQMVANDKASTPDWPPKRQFFVDAHAHLFAVKNAWRNPSMHLEKKYEEAEAERIYRAVKDFMEHLATHLNASGQFTP